MPIHYRYFGILFKDDSPDDPTGIVRVWIGPSGDQLAEVFTRSLIWEETLRLTRWDRSNEERYVEIDVPLVNRFIEEMTKKINAEFDKPIS